MWIFTTHGFFSIVEYPTQKDSFVVRARCKKHLEELKLHYYELSDCSIIETPFGDYLYRMLVDKEVWANCIADIAANINYPNFKTAAKESLLSKLYDECLHRIWGTTMMLQAPKEPPKWLGDTRRIIRKVLKEFGVRSTSNDITSIFRGVQDDLSSGQLAELIVSNYGINTQLAKQITERIYCVLEEQGYAEEQDNAEKS